MKHKWRIFFERPVEILPGYFFPYLDYETDIDTDDSQMIQEKVQPDLERLCEPYTISLIRKL